MIWNVGDAPVVTYYLRDSLGVLTDATVTCRVTSPSGAVTNPVPTHPATGTYQVVPTLTEASTDTADWVVEFTATGLVVDAQVNRIRAVAASDQIAPSGLPSWAPSLQDVAVHIPTRTRRVGLDNTLAGTFDADTTPTGEQVMRIIAHACDRVTGCTGLPVVPAAYGLAGTAAALWAAYWVEIAYPERDADVTVYDRLRVDAEELCSRAGEVNIANGGGGTVDPGADDDGDGPMTISYTFPTPPAWGDLTFI